MQTCTILEYAYYLVTRKLPPCTGQVTSFNLSDQVSKQSTKIRMRPVSANIFLFAPLLLALSSVAAFAPVAFPRQQNQYASLNSRSSDMRVFQSIQEHEDEYLDRATKSEGVIAKPDVVYIIMYNPSTPEEGIHTVEYPRGSQEDLLLAFGSLEDCVSFSRTIREDPSVPHEPIPTPTSMVQIEAACQGMGLPMKIVPASK